MASELNNSQNWFLSYQDYKESMQVTPLGGYTPLPAFEVPILFSSKVLIVRTNSTIPAGKRWKWAGNLRAFQRLPNAGINSQKSEIASYSLFLNRSKLITLPEIASGYELVLSDAFWLRNLQLTIYEFTGSISDNLTQLVTTVQNDILRIESKIDSL